jgi:hypothetical protein
LPLGAGRISSQIGGKTLPSPARPGRVLVSIPTAEIRERDYWDKAGARVSTWPDVAHSPTRSLNCRVLAAERGISRIELLGEWHRSAQRRRIAQPATTVADPG